MEQELILSPSDFVAVLNQTLEFAYPAVTIVGELANFRVSKNRWVYFDLKDEHSSVKFFGTVYTLPGPLEDGMMLKVIGQPRLSPQYGFSIVTSSIQPVGEGSLKRAANLLQAKLEKEGLFDASRKRSIPYPPSHIGLIASNESAAYADFNKVLNARWQGVKISHVNVQVQGEQAVSDIVKAVERLNQLGKAPEVIVITRGGGSADDLAAFSTEQVTRAVAGSRIPTLVAIGHEVDVSLAELAADVHASTPSNAAELLVPDRKAVKAELKAAKNLLDVSLVNVLAAWQNKVEHSAERLHNLLKQRVEATEQMLVQSVHLLKALNPDAILRRGYAVIRANGELVTSARKLKPKTAAEIQFFDGTAHVTVNKVK